MTHEEFVKRVTAFAEKIPGIVAKKNSDYAGDDALSGFKMVEELGVCKANIGILARMSEKVSRMENFIDKGVLNVADETIEDTAIDLAGAALIYAVCASAER